MLSVIIFLNVLFIGSWLVYKFVRKPNFWWSGYDHRGGDHPGIWEMVERVRKNG